MEKDISLEEMVSTVAPHFRYQIQFASGDLEKVIQSKTEIKQLLCALYGGRTPQGEFAFDAEQGVLLDKLARLRPSRLLSEEELEYYAGEFARNGIHGPCMLFRFSDVWVDVDADGYSELVSDPQSQL